MYLRWFIYFCILCKMIFGCVIYLFFLNRVVVLKFLCGFIKSFVNLCVCYWENYNDLYFVYDYNCIVREVEDTWGCIDVFFKIILELDFYYKVFVLWEYMNNDCFGENLKNL